MLPRLYSPMYVSHLRYASPINTFFSDVSRAGGVTSSATKASHAAQAHAGHSCAPKPMEKPRSMRYRVVSLARRDMLCRWTDDMTQSLTPHKQVRNPLHQWLTVRQSP